MPFLRFSRDKRGYEHTYLVQSTNKRGKPIKPRILYWYRTPPGVRLGRSPFDDEVRQLLEAQNPGIVFDWATLANTPFPSQEPEFWRERRRAEKAAKQARREEENDEPGGNDVDGGLAEGTREAEAATESAQPPTRPAVSEGEGEEVTTAALDSVGDAAAPAAAVTGDAEGADTPAARKRRRRGGRRRRNRPVAADGGAGQAASSESGSGDPSNEPDLASEEQE